MKESLGPVAVALIAVISIAGASRAADLNARGQRDAGTRGLSPKTFALTHRRAALGAAPSSVKAQDSHIREFLGWKEQWSAASGRAVERSR